MKNKFTIAEVRKHWDEVAEIYEPTNSAVGYVHTQRFEKAMKFASLKSGEKVLNIWSRTGKLIPYIRKIKGINLVNREASIRMIDIAKKNYPKEDFGQTDLTSLKEFPNSSFDKIISLETLEHTPYPVKLVKEFERILKPNGVLVLSLPPRGFEIPTVVYDHIFTNHGEGPHKFLWSWEVKKIFQNTKLRLAIHQGFIILPTPHDRLTRMSEVIFTTVFKHTPVIEFGVRHFYVYTKDATTKRSRL